MKVQLSAHMVDASTADVGSALRPIFERLGRELSGEYGGVMEHLWIDLELIESHARQDGTPQHRFRFAKRVSGGRPPFGLPPLPDWFNVGHYSVRPDFKRIASLPEQEAIEYALSLLYDSTEVLLSKQKKLGGFDAALFRERFLIAVKRA